MQGRSVDPVGWERHPLPQGHLHGCISLLREARIRLVPSRSDLAPRAGRGESGVSLASLETASSFPRCEIRQLLVHTYPAGHKSPGAERVTVFYGRRGRPVKKPHFIPTERAHHWAPKLQARRLGTVSVVWSHRPPAAASATRAAAAGLRGSGAASWTSGGMPTM